MNRRAFISLLGGAAAAWPLAARAQQPTMPVIGFLNAGSLGTGAVLYPVFRQSLAEAGYVEGRNVAIEYRWAEGQYDRLPALAEELARRQVATIVAVPIPAALAAKAATATIPIVFSVAGDPVKLGLVAGLARPGGNATGVNFFQAELGAKQLGLLRELLPTAVRIGLLVNSANPNVEGETKEATAASSAMGVQIEIVHASDSHQIESAFATLAQAAAQALLVTADPFFTSQRERIVTLAARHKIPAIYEARGYAVAGGLMSYGPNVPDMYRQVGVYAGQILKGVKPADLPVVQPTALELVINLKEAKAIGLDVPAQLLARADEAIE